MGYNFNLRSVLVENGIGNIQQSVNENNVDEILSKESLSSVLESATPIADIVSAKLYENACDPMQLSIVMDENSNSFYMDYNEFSGYCEATGFIPSIAMYTILEAYEDEFPEMTLENFHIVFPSNEAFNEAVKTPGKYGYHELAMTSHFMKLCTESGIAVSVFDEATPVIGVGGSGKTVTSEKWALTVNKLFSKACSAIKKEDYSDTAVIKKRLSRVNRTIEQLKREKDLYSKQSESSKMSQKISYKVVSIISFLLGLKIVSGNGPIKITTDNPKSNKVIRASEIISGITLIKNANDFYVNSDSYVKVLDNALASVNDVKTFLENELKDSENKKED